VDTLAQVKHLMMNGMSAAERETCIGAMIHDFGETAFRDRFQEDGTFAIASWDELRRVAAAGVEILSHGMDHAPHTDSLSDRELQRDVADSRARIAEMTGRAPSGYALPGGVGGGRSHRAVAGAGYGFCLTTQTGRVRRDSAVFALPRIDAEYPLDVLRWHMLAL